MSERSFHPGLKADAMATNRRPGRKFDPVAAAVCTAVLLIAGFLNSWGPLPEFLALECAFPPSKPGLCEPLITTGEYGNSDFLTVHYKDGNRATIAYDAWGSGGPESAPFSYVPGKRHSLTVRMPSLLATAGGVDVRNASLLVNLDGQQVLRGGVPYHRRKPGDVSFGTNEIGGSPEVRFRGKLWTSTGRELSGGLGTYFTFGQRLEAFSSRPLLIAVLLVTGMLAGLVAPWLALWYRNRPPSEVRPAATTRPLVWFWISAVLATWAFAHVITGGEYKFVYPESFGNFYDHQAVSLLHGHLDVPVEAITDEAFIHNGKAYGYFGPTPALLRIPFVLLGVGFGQLSRPLMVLQFLACLGAAYSMLCHAVRLRSGRVAWPSAWATVTFVMASGIGSTLFFLSSRAYIYHEAILCGAAFALWSCVFTFRYLEAPRARWWIAALVCGVLAVHARPPMGLFALAFTGIVAAINLVRQRAGTPAAPRTTHLAVGALAVVGVLSFNGLGYLKFGTFNGCPLQYHVQYTPARLARFEGKLFHVGDIPFNFDIYFRHRTVQATKKFPFFETRPLDPRPYRSAKLDLVEPTSGVPWAMPALFVLALAGLLAWKQSQGGLRWQLTAVWAAAVPLFGAMLAAVAVSHRYTADFVPFLITSGALGIALVDRMPRAVRVLITAACLLSMAITTALTFTFQNEVVWGVPKQRQQRYHDLQERVDRFFRR